MESAATSLDRAAREKRERQGVDAYSKLRAQIKAMVRAYLDNARPWFEASGGDWSVDEARNSGALAAATQATLELSAAANSAFRQVTQQVRRQAFINSSHASQVAAEAITGFRPHVNSLAVALREAAAWDESRHPREPAGADGGKGGEFTSAAGSEVVIEPREPFMGGKDEHRDLASLMGPDGNVVEGRVGSYPLTTTERGIVVKISKRTKAMLEQAMADPEVRDALREAGIKNFCLRPRKMYREDYGTWTMGHSGDAILFHTRTAEDILKSTVPERREFGVKRIIFHEAGHALWDRASDELKRDFGRAVTPAVKEEISKIVDLGRKREAMWSTADEREASELHAEVQAMRRYAPVRYAAFPAELRAVAEKIWPAKIRESIIVAGRHVEILREAETITVAGLKVQVSKPTSLPGEPDDPQPYEDGRRITGRVVILESDGNVWLQDPEDEPYVMLPGGGIEAGEALQQAAVRECLEEVGLVVELTSYLADITDQRAHRRYYTGRRVHALLEAGFDPSKHPRAPARSQHGGEFVAGTGTPEFKQWFGDSKVVDESGKPRVMYHGTDSAEDFPAFGASQDVGFHFGPLSAAASRLNQVGESGGKRILPVFLKVDNPLRLPDLGTWDSSDVASALRDAGVLDAAKADDLSGFLDADTFRDVLEAAGYDGVVYSNATEGGGDSYIALRPEQIKSAWNRGTWSKSSPKLSEADLPQNGLPDTAGGRVWAWDDEDGQSPVRVRCVPYEAAVGLLTSEFDRCALAIARKRLSEAGNGWDESKHPRAPRGSDTGGEFTSAGGDGGSSKPSSNSGRTDRSVRLDTPEFKSWFRDSRVVDAGGKPLLVYHGTHAAFDRFDSTFDGTTTGNLGHFGNGFYFSVDPAEANTYAGKYFVDKEEGGNVIPVYLSIQHPLIINDSLSSKKELVRIGKKYGLNVSSGRTRVSLHYLIQDNGSKEFTDAIKAEGYDGIVSADAKGRPDGEIVAFKPEQIKSVFNRGAWDSKSAKLSETGFDPSKHPRRPVRVGKGK